MPFSFVPVEKKHTVFPPIYRRKEGALPVGAAVGAAVGASLGAVVGATVGASVGAVVRAAVGTAVEAVIGAVVEGVMGAGVRLGIEADDNGNQWDC